MQIPIKEYWTLLVHYVRPHWRRVFLLAVVLFSTIGLQLLAPQILRSFIDNALAKQPFDVLLKTALLFTVLVLLSQFLNVFSTYISGSIGWKATNRLRADLALHCLRLDMDSLQKYSAGILIDRIDADVSALSTFFSQFVIRLVGSMILLIGVIVLVFLDNMLAGIVLSGFAVGALLVLHRLRDIGVPSAVKEREVNSQLFGFLEERLAGIDDIRANGAGAYTMRGFHEHMRARLRQGTKTALMNLGAVRILTAGLFSLGYIVVLGTGIDLFIHSIITLGTVYLFFQYTQMLKAPLEQLSDQLRDLQQASGSVVRVRELLQERSVIVSGTRTDLTPGSLALSFHNVSFEYHKAQPVLHGISFDLAPGRILGVLGHTGSGKTTLARLLTRLYDPNQGTITLNGIDIRELQLELLRQRIAIVTQDVQLFHATVRNNITFFNPAISDQVILEILRKLGLWRWYELLPHGLDTLIDTKGSSLSAGEAQLLALTRIFLMDPGLVIMDEASSRLDPLTQHMLEQAISQLLQGRTAIIITHRLSTLQRADQLLILDRGTVVEYGSYTELTADTNTRFAQLLRTGNQEVLA